jgi:hypothetical protein
MVLQLFDLVLVYLRIVCTQELKAQLESQQPLRDEAFGLLEQALAMLSVQDEEKVRENFTSFDDRWRNLVKLVSETELENYGEDEDVSSTQNTLESVDKEMQGMQDTIQQLAVVVENEEDLYSYLETLQVCIFKSAHA